MHQRQRSRPVTNPPTTSPQPLAHVTFSIDARLKEQENSSFAANPDDNYEKIDRGCYTALSKLTILDEHQYTTLSKQKLQEENYTPLSQQTITEQQCYTALSPETKMLSADNFTKRILVQTEQDPIYY